MKMMVGTRKFSMGLMSSVIMMGVSKAYATYEVRNFLCFYGPDAYGNFFEDIVTEWDAMDCGDFCHCKDIVTECLVGPDEFGNFATKATTD